MHVLPLHHHGTERKCAGSGWRGKKNGGTEVPPFPLQGLPGFPECISPLKRVPKIFSSETLEIYGVNEGSRTPGLQDHNLAL